MMKIYSNVSRTKEKEDKEILILEHIGSWFESQWISNIFDKLEL